MPLAQAAAAAGPLPFIREGWPPGQRVRTDVPTAAALPAGGFPRAREHFPRAREHQAARFPAFRAIGGGVFPAALHPVLVRGLRIGPVAGYIVRAIAAVQLSFLLDRYATARDRGVLFWAAGRRKYRGKGTPAA